MSAVLQLHGRYICNSNTPRYVSPEKDTTGMRNRNPDIVREPRISKTARITYRNRSKTPKLNHMTLTRALRAFADSGSMENAVHLFEEMNQADTFIWNMMIRGFANCGSYREAIDFYWKMVLKGVKTDNFTYPFAIKACAGMLWLDEGEKVHAQLFKLGFCSDLYICNSLISMYMKLGCSQLAEKIFEEMPERDLVSWNSMISGYHVLGDGLSSLMYFKEMLDFKSIPDRFSMISVLGACSVESCLKSGKEMHCQVLRSDLEMDVMVQTSLLDMYSKCGLVDYAERVFNSMIFPRNIVVWNAMVGCYARNGCFIDSFDCLRQMVEDDDDIKPDAVTLINLLPACALLEGKSIHGCAIRKGFLPHLVLESALIDMYGECRKLESAERIFVRMTEKNLVSWNSLISAYVHNGQSKSALKLFQVLQSSSLKPDFITLASILPAYAESVSLSEGAQLHAYIIKSELGSNTIISNSLVYMYAKCGDLKNARKCFDCIKYKDVVSWNTIIMAYGIHGFGRISIQLFTEMMEDGVKPNESTFASILSACSVSGMIEEGWVYFHSLKGEYGIDPSIEHYGYMLDLLGRSGNLDLAKSFIEEIPFAPTARIWGSVLTASRNHNDIAMAELAAKQIFSLEHDNTGCYILLSNMYAEAGRWEDVERIRSLMKNKGLSRTESCSMVEMNCKTHTFTNGDKSHVERNTIYDVLDIFSRKMVEDAYVHRLSKFRPENVVKNKANWPVNHSVRLGICFGLISRDLGKPVLVRNNTRICKQCHDFTKKISKVTQREIVVGDSKVFHHFQDGHCSCGDYW